MIDCHYVFDISKRYILWYQCSPHPIVGQPGARDMGKKIMATFSYKFYIGKLIIFYRKLWKWRQVNNNFWDMSSPWYMVWMLSCQSILSCIIWLGRWLIKHQSPVIMVLCFVKPTHQGLLCQVGYRYRMGSQRISSSEWIGQCPWTATGALLYRSIKGIRGS